MAIPVKDTDESRGSIWRRLDEHLAVSAIRESNRVCYHDSIYVRDDKSYLCHFRYLGEVLDLSLWKYSFDLVTRELDLAEKKKQALDNLFSANKISQSTYDYLETELSTAIADLEDHLKSIKDKMAMRAQELEKQVNTLELFLASLEIHHAAGDVDDETYGKQSDAILLGLEATKVELASIRSASQKAVPKPAEVPTLPEPEETTEGTEFTESTEIEEEESPSAEEPLFYEPVESVETVEPSHEEMADVAFEEPDESEDLPLASYSEEPSEQLSPSPETTTEY